MELLWCLFGFITGLLLSILVVATLAFFRAGIEQRVKIIEKQLGATGPKPQGFIVEPTPEIDEARQAIIERNAKHGRPTNITELL